VEIRSNVVFEHLLDSNKKIIIEQGGTRSGKTYNILLWLIYYYCPNNRNKTITICRKTFPALRATVMRDFLDILRGSDMYREEDHNKSNSEYHLYGNLIEFISLDQPQKVRGRKRDLLYANEVNELTWEDWQQLLFRTEGRIIGDFNPSDEYHWLYDKVISREDCDFFKTTYKDNPFLSLELIKEIERLRETDEQYWQIYGLGERAISRATIYSYTEIEKVPENASFLSYGMDYGFTNDPTALVAIFKHEHNLYFKEMLYRTGMTTQDINQFLRSKQIDGPIYADTAEPRLNEELKRMGWNIRKSEKDIRAGIDMLKRHKLHVTKDSANLIMEFRNYKWKEDKSGIITNAPVDEHNHLLDSCRYGTYSILSKPNLGKYAIN
jgi:phage terminase large subunit